jgi:hypothetical protein
MRLTVISDYDARPGRLMEWRLHPVTVAAAADAPLDSRPASFMQEGHVRTAAWLRDAGISAPTWLATGFDIAGALDLDAMQAVFQQWIARHETLRSGLRLVADELERFTLDDASMSVQRVAIEDFAHGADVLRYLEDRFDVATNPLVWPSYCLITVSRDDDFTVYLAFDHTNVDGYSMALIAQEFHELYDAAVAGRDASLPAAGSHVDFSKAERDRADHVDGNHEAVRHWRSFIRACGDELPRFPLDLGVARGDLPVQTGACEWLLDAPDAAAFAAACKLAGGNMLAGILTTAAITARELGGVPVYRTIIPFHTRTEPRWAASLGWYIGLGPIELDMTCPQDFRGLLAAARDAARAAKPIADVPFLKIFSLLQTNPRPQSVISFIDGRTLPGARRWEAWNAQAFGKVSYGDEVYMWVNRNLDGMYLTCRYPDTDLANTNVAAYIAHLRTVLAAVARDGSYVVTSGPNQSRRFTRDHDEAQAALA